MTLANDESFTEEKTHISAKDIIDLDSRSDTLISWPCESTLKVFRVRISGIPRPGITRIAREEYPGQRRDLQHRVYERLARFTHLERLELGNQGPWRIEEIFHRLPPGVEIKDQWRNHVDCMDLTLTSGLRKLGGLKELREVSVKSLATFIGVQEVQWMVESWPRLEAVYGLMPRAVKVEVHAGKWLKENYPQIRQNATYPALVS